MFGRNNIFVVIEVISRLFLWLSDHLNDSWLLSFDVFSGFFQVGLRKYHFVLFLFCRLWFWLLVDLRLSGSLSLGKGLLLYLFRGFFVFLPNSFKFGDIFLIIDVLVVVFSNHNEL